jgi:hypothetical protein
LPHGETGVALGAGQQAVQGFRCRGGRHGH